jgi:uncharacterized protein YndB with AHSA1/START domain
MPKSSTKANVGDAVTHAERAMSEFGVVPEARTLRIRRVLPGPIERVWAFLTESEKRAKWLASGPMELHVGGRVELTFHHSSLAACPEPTPEKYRKHEGTGIEGRITRCEPPSLLSFTWGKGRGEHSEVTFELTPAGEDVVLVLTHRRLPDRGTMVGVGSGWHTHLGVLVDLLEGQAPRAFWSTFARLEAEYERRLPTD